MIRLPVCSPERAWKTWDDADDDEKNHESYPCQILKGLDFCSKSTFVDETSGASPLVEDCLQLAKNIEEDSTKAWDVLLWGHETLDKHGTCAIGAEARHAADGNQHFWFGGQDAIDILRDAANNFGDGKRMGGKGNLDCDGDNMVEQVRWGIYQP